MPVVYLFLGGLGAWLSLVWSEMIGDLVCPSVLFAGTCLSSLVWLSLPIDSLAFYGSTNRLFNDFFRNFAGVILGVFPTI